MQDVQLLNELFPSSRGVQSEGGGPSELGQEDFLTLLVAQLQNQNPTQPADNMEFISQIAQFGTVTGIQDLQSSFSSFSSVLFGNQGLQAAGLVGSQVLASGNTAALSAEQAVNGTVLVPQSVADVKVDIHDSNGVLVHSLSLGPAAAGDFQFQWDGTDADGEALPPGNYLFSAEALVGGQNQALQVSAHNRVSSVTIDRNGANILLNLDTGEQINIAQVQGFM